MMKRYQKNVRATNRSPTNADALNVVGCGRSSSMPEVVFDNDSESETEDTSSRGRRRPLKTSRSFGSSSSSKSWGNSGGITPKKDSTSSPPSSLNLRLALKRTPSAIIEERMKMFNTHKTKPTGNISSSDNTLINSKKTWSSSRDVTNASRQSHQRKSPRAGKMSKAMSEKNLTATTTASSSTTIKSKWQQQHYQQQQVLQKATTLLSSSPLAQSSSELSPSSRRQPQYDDQQVGAPPPPIDPPSPPTTAPHTCPVRLRKKAVVTSLPPDMSSMTPPGSKSRLPAREKSTGSSDSSSSISERMKMFSTTPPTTNLKETKKQWSSCRDFGVSTTPKASSKKVAKDKLTSEGFTKRSFLQKAGSAGNLSTKYGHNKSPAKKPNIESFSHQHYPRSNHDRDTTSANSSERFARPNTVTKYVSTKAKDFLQKSSSLDDDDRDVKATPSPAPIPSYSLSSKSSRHHKEEEIRLLLQELKGSVKSKATEYDDIEQENRRIRSDSMNSSRISDNKKKHRKKKNRSIEFLLPILPECLEAAETKFKEKSIVLHNNLKFNERNNAWKNVGARPLSDEVRHFGQNLDSLQHPCALIV